MSIGRLIRKKIEGDTTLVDVIDTQLKKRDVFSLDTVSEKAERFSEFLKEGKHDFDKFQKLFYDLWLSVFADKPRTGKRFHPSSLMDDCPRMLFYEFTDVEPTDRVKGSISPQTQRTFDVGTWWHTYIQVLLWKAGVLEQAEVPIINRRKRISGHGDGIVRHNGKRYMLEIKTMNSFQFAKGKFAPFDKHEYQASVYASELKIDFIIYLYINKDTAEIKIHERPVNKKFVGFANDKITEVLTAVREEVAPERICKDIESPATKKCPFKTYCFK